MQSQAASAAAPEPESGTPSPQRLVIRVKLVPQAPSAPPVWRRLNKGALLVILGAAVALSWAGISMLGPGSTAAPESADVMELQRSLPGPPISGATRGSNDQSPPTRATDTAGAKSAEIKPPDAEAPEQPEPPPSSIDEVIPEVPRSALDTIRGTVRVTMRVTLDQSGAVRTVSADDPGPSRYFERLATEAAKKWTFTPATSEEQRIMLVKFNFTRAGATASASSPE